ncbi:MAG: hypothetical protein K6B41_12495 [Butyrivibrio sp.]|nr:hypothetical protein [Butyrivibrio sp.]
MSVFMMIVSFLIMAGIASAATKLTKCVMAEGFVFSAMTITFIMWVTGILSCFNVGIYIVVALGVIGYAVSFYHSNDYKKYIEPAFVVLFAIFVGSLVLYHNDFIQHIDELHQWALVVKHMLYTGTMPGALEYAGDAHQLIGTSLFILFFQKMGGYNEGHMYVASAFLCFIGFLLPFGRIKKEKAHKIVLYVIFLYLSIYPLYRYGFKSLYVDLAPMAWTAGISLFWILRDKEKRIVNTFLLIGSMVMIYSFKLYVGAMLDMFVLLIVICDLFCERYSKLEEDSRKKWKKGLVIFISAGVVVFIGAVMFLINYQITNNRISTEQLSVITSAYITSFFTSVINSRSLYHIRPAVIILMIALVLFVQHKVSDKSNVFYNRMIALSMGLFAFAFLVVLWLAYLFVFNAFESSQAFGSQRYFSIMLTMLFMFAVSRLILSRDDVLISIKGLKRKYTVQTIFMFVSIAVFLVGVNKKFIADSSTFCTSSISSYGVIKKAQKHIAKVQDILMPEDKVFMVHQGADLETLNNKAQYPQNMALYYFGWQVNNCLYQPWKFTPKGSYVAITETDLFTIENLPQFLTEGGYTYFWVFKSDEYLEDQLPKVMDIEGGKVINSSLYKIEYVNGVAVGLKYVVKL